jgi:acetyltransferase-like isoleucine patch superfamily enzyme
MDTRIHRNLKNYNMLLLKKIYRFIRSYIYYVINFITLSYNGVIYEETPTINGFLKVIGKKNIFLGKKLRINSSLSSNPIGLTTKTVLAATNGGQIVIGDNVGISGSLIWSRCLITIEDNVLIGGGCQIFDNDFHSLDYVDRILKGDTNVKSKEVRIKEGAFIGTSSIIGKGVTIGARSIIAAGSVVTRSIPDEEIWGGNPAKFIKKN